MRVRDFADKWKLVQLPGDTDKVYSVLQTEVGFFGAQSRTKYGKPFMSGKPTKAMIDLLNATGVELPMVYSDEISDPRYDPTNLVQNSQSSVVAGAIMENGVPQRITFGQHTIERLDAEKYATKDLAGQVVEMMNSNMDAMAPLFNESGELVNATVFEGQAAAA